MRRRSFAALLPVLVVAGCGFQLRKAPDFAFESILVPSSGLVGTDLRRNLASTGKLKVLPPNAPSAQAQVILDILTEVRDKVIVGLNASGQVREFQLRSRVRFQLRTPQGKELIPSTELALQRDVSFNESAVLAKESEEALLFRDMQNDIVQQLMRRIAAIKAL